MGESLLTRIAPRRIFTTAERPSSETEGCCKRERDGEPCNAPKEVRADRTRRPTGNSTLPVRLILEDGGEVANDVDDSEDEAVLRAHGEVGAGIPDKG